MKTRGIITAVGVVLGSTLFAVAAPPSKSTYTSSALRTVEEFEALQKGDTIAMVCAECSTVTVKTLESADEAMNLCKDGETVVCASCNKVAKVVRRGPRSQGVAGKRQEVHYLNETGDDCMFVARLKS